MGQTTTTPEFSTLTPTRDGAQPTNLAGETCAFVEDMTDAAGHPHKVYYGFSKQEEDAAAGEASNLPFDERHVLRIS